MKRTLSAHAARLCRLPERQPAARGVFETIAVQGHRRAHSNTQSPPGKLGGFCKLTKYLRLRPRSLRPATFADNNLLTFIRYLIPRQTKRRRMPLGGACRLCEPKCKAASESAYRTSEGPIRNPPTAAPCKRDGGGVGGQSTPRRPASHRSASPRIATQRSFVNLSARRGASPRSAALRIASQRNELFGLRGACDGGRAPFSLKQQNPPSFPGWLSLAGSVGLSRGVG